MVDSQDDEFQKLCEAVRRGKVIFWVGAGFSKYAEYPTGKEFTKYLQKVLKIPEDETQLLSEVSSNFSNREELLEIIKKIFGNPPKNTASHDSLSLISQIPYIITTNYDMLFEISYKYKIKSIADECELPTTAGIPQKTIVYKIHGDVSHLNKIIITTNDYQNFDSNSLLWDKIKTILAEYSVVFLGYSLEDNNVQDVLELVFRRIGDHTNPYFFLTRHLTEDKKAFLNKYNIIPIEIEATDAITQIKEYVARYAFVDSGTDPVILAQNASILESKKVKVCSVVDGDKITACIIDTVPNSGVKVTAISQKKPTTPYSREVNEWFDTISGAKFDSVTITDPWSKIQLEVMAGDVIVLNPVESGLKLETITLTPNPKSTYSADLQVDDIRFSNATIKEYESSTHSQIVFEHEWFLFSLHCQKNQDVNNLTVEFNLKTRDVSTNIDKGKEIFSFFKKWFDGNKMNIIRTPQELSSVVESLPVRDTDFYQDIEARQQLFEILSDIQKISKLRLTTPDKISFEELQKIFWIGNFLRGKPEPQERISCQVIHLHDGSYTPSKNIPIPQVTIEGMMEFNLFGQRIPLNYIIQGTDCIVENYDEISVQLEQRRLPIIVVFTSQKNDLCLRYNPSRKES